MFAWLIPMLWSKSSLVIIMTIMCRSRVAILMSVAVGITSWSGIMGNMVLKALMTPGTDVSILEFSLWCVEINILTWLTTIELKATNSSILTGKQWAAWMEKMETGVSVVMLQGKGEWRMGDGSSWMQRSSINSAPPDACILLFYLQFYQELFFICVVLVSHILIESVMYTPDAAAAGYWCSCINLWRKKLLHLLTLTPVWWSWWWLFFFLLLYHEHLVPLILESEESKCSASSYSLILLLLEDTQLEDRVIHRFERQELKGILASSSSLPSVVVFAAASTPVIQLPSSLLLISTSSHLSGGTATKKRDTQREFIRIISIRHQLSSHICFVHILLPFDSLIINN